MRKTLYISHEPEFYEVAQIIACLKKRDLHYDDIVNITTGEVYATRVIADCWEIHR